MKDLKDGNYRGTRIWRTYFLPEKSVFCHVFAIGDQKPWLLADPAKEGVL